MSPDAEARRALAALEVISGAAEDNGDDVAPYIAAHAVAWSLLAIAEAVDALVSGDGVPVRQAGAWSQTTYNVTP